MKIEKRILAAVISVGLLTAGSGAAISSAHTLTETVSEEESDAAKQVSVPATYDAAEQKALVNKNQSTETQQAKCSFDEKTGCLTFSGPGVITGDIEDASNEAGMKYLDIGRWGDGVLWGNDSGVSIEKREVKSIVVGDGVTEIGEGVFTYLSGLKSVVIGDSVKSIGEGAFGCCRSLKEITIGNGVTEIGAAAFADCDAIEKITIGKSVKNLGERFLGEAPNLREIIVADGNEHLKIKGNILYSKDGRVLYLSPKKEMDKVIIAKGTKVIRQLAFSNASIDKVTIPASVQVLEAGAFYFCEKLKTVTFAKGSKCLRTEEYYQYFGDEVEEYYTVFGWCRKLKSISFGNKFETLSENTFQNCIRLQSIHFGKNFRGFTQVDNKIITTAMKQEDLAALKKITVSKSNPKFSSKKGILYSKSKKKLCLYPLGKKSSFLTIADSVQIIGKDAFWGNKTLQKVVFGNKVKKVEAFAFGNCSKLAAVDMKANLNRIGESAFAHCSRLSDVRWSQKVRYVGNYAFFGCIRLKSIVFSNRTDVVVRRGAFWDCRKVTNVVWPKGFCKVGMEAFCNCKKITAAVLSGKDLTVCYRAFSNCTSLKKVTIKSGVAKIRTEAFYECTALHSIFIPKSVQQIGYKAFGWKWSTDTFSDVRMKSFQIQGKKGSQAENYAKNNKIKFVVQ